MAFTPPVFNLLCNMWFNGHPPLTNPPDYIDVPCQLYLNSRESPDTQQPPWYTGNFWFPAVVLRTPLDTYDKLVLFVEVPAGGGLYYTIQYTHPQHLGFINEYMMSLLTMYSPTLAQEVLFYGENT